MIRVSVVSTKELVKIISKILACLIIFVILINILKYSNAHFSQTEIDTSKCISYLTEEITVMGETKDPDISKVNPKSILESELMFSDDILLAQSSDYELTHNIEEEDNTDTSENADEVVTVGNETDNPDTQSNEIAIQDVEQGLKTEVIKSTYTPTCNYTVDGVKIKNETSINLDTVNLSSSNANVKNKNVIIFHTHTCESYTQTENNKYTPSGNYRTTDLNHSVVRVGDVLQSYLTNYGFNVTHDKTYHDYPAYNGSYGRSLKTVSNLLSKGESADIIIDLHRDAMNDETYAPKVKIGDEYVSQIMFVIGTNGSGLEHDNWKNNLEYAIKVQKKADEMYPGLFKPIIVRNARYNQHLSSAATIIEFGATGNTLEECEGAAKYLAKVLEAVVQ